jgi:hypothetical protein
MQARPAFPIVIIVFVKKKERIFILFMIGKKRSRDQQNERHEMNALLYLMLMFCMTPFFVSCIISCLKDATLPSKQHAF